MSNAERTKAITAALIKEWQNRKFLCVRNVRNHTGYHAIGRERYCDMFAIHPWPSKTPEKEGRPAGLYRIAFEVKVSAGDFNNELLDPTKREPFVEMSNEFYFVAPTGVIDGAKVPCNCGLIEWDGLKFKTVKASAWNEQPPRWDFVASLLRSTIGQAVNAAEYKEGK